ncbi:MAG TPA: DUF2939 domain-containing protein [Xanthomonadaceae bacterium]|nr:DUF2939 domain-containing protein [Xanthomonadaceae bacterium]
MRKLAALLLIAVLALLGYVAAGPWMTMHAIRDALRDHDAAALARQVDFPALRGSLKGQLEDRLARATGPDWQGNAFGRLGLLVAGGGLDASVDALVTPGGLAALMEGHAVWNRATGQPVTAAEGAPEPLHAARQRYESPSRFTATIHDDAGRPLVFVLRRDGLRWKLADILLPPPS